jgi:hypothetical protein
MPRHRWGRPATARSHNTNSIGICVADIYAFFLRHWVNLHQFIATAA